MDERAVTDCKICRIVAGVEPALIVSETETVVSFLPLTMQASGHTVIATKAHRAGLLDASAEDWAEVLGEAKRLAVSYQERIGTTGFNILHASGVDAQQSVPHLHVHLIPRSPGDGVDAWPTLGPAIENPEEALRRLTG